VNELSQLEELHLYAQFRRGRQRLVKDCAEFVLGRFPKLKHLVRLFVLMCVNLISYQRSFLGNYKWYFMIHKLVSYLVKCLKNKTIFAKINRH